MKKERRVYENGYWGKISYWSTLLETAVREQNTKGALLCSEKLSYFTERQKELVKQLLPSTKVLIFRYINN